MADEKRLINANAYPCRNCTRAYCLRNCKKLTEWFEKTIDAVEVVHGRWVLCQDDGYEWYECSSCRTQPLNDYVERPALSGYCPNCGAKMDGGNTQ